MHLFSVTCHYSNWNNSNKNHILKPKCFQPHFRYIFGHIYSSRFEHVIFISIKFRPTPIIFVYSFNTSAIACNIPLREFVRESRRAISAVRECCVTLAGRAANGSHAHTSSPSRRWCCCCDSSNSRRWCDSRTTRVLATRHSSARALKMSVCVCVCVARYETCEWVSTKNVCVCVWSCDRARFDYFGSARMVLWRVYIDVTQICETKRRRSIVLANIDR